MNSKHGAAGRVVMVTGGASGMGAAMCRHLAALGYRLSVLDVDEAGAQGVADESRSTGTEALAVGADVTDPAAVEEAFAKTRTELGPVEIVITSAGITAVEPTTEITFESWNRVIAVNLTGTFLCCRAAIPAMADAGWGRIVTISSSSASRGSPRMAHYVSSKGGVIALTKSLARELGPLGITVNNIQPSGIATPMLSGTQHDGKLPTDDRIIASIPVGHLGTGEDVAATAAFLCSDAAGYITGQVVGVNGGSLV